MAKKKVAKKKTPQKTCRECGEKVHVRNKVCEHCGHVFSPTNIKPLSTNDAVDTVLMAVQLVKRLGPGEAIKLIKKVAEEV